MKVILENPKLKILFFAFFAVLSANSPAKASTLASFGTTIFTIGTDGQIYSRGQMSDWSLFDVQLPKKDDVRAVAITVATQGLGAGAMHYLYVISDDGSSYWLWLDKKRKMKSFAKSLTRLPGEVLPLATSALPELTNDLDQE